MAKGPVLIDLEAEKPGPSVADAPPVPDLTPLTADGEAMRAAAQLAARKPSRLTRWFFGLGTALLGTVVSVAAWDFVTGLVARTPVLGWSIAVLFCGFLAVFFGCLLYSEYVCIWYSCMYVCVLVCLVQTIISDACN